MQKLKVMKVHVHGERHSSEVQKALFALGYKWSSHGQSVAFPGASFLFVCERGYITYTSWDAKYFAEHANPEYVLVGGEFIIKEEAANPRKPPLGLRPRHIAAGERVCEILEAMHRYAKEFKQVPHEWLRELEDLNAELKA